MTPNQINITQITINIPSQSNQSLDLVAIALSLNYYPSLQLPTVDFYWPVYINQHNEHQSLSTISELLLCNNDVVATSTSNRLPPMVWQRNILKLWLPSDPLVIKHGKGETYNLYPAANDGTTLGNQIKKQQTPLTTWPVTPIEKPWKTIYPTLYNLTKQLKIHKILMVSQVSL